MNTQTNFREILRNKYQLRVEKNKRYSLRAYAKDLGMSPSLLSDIFGGKKGLSPERAQEVSKRLHLGDVEATFFCDLVTSEHARTEKKRQSARTRVAKYKKVQVQNLTMESFALVYDWYHFAILEATHLKHFKGDVVWLAERLKIGEDKIKHAVERLVAMDLLEITPEGKWVDTQKDLASPDGFSFSYLRKFHKQLIDKALVALEEQSVDERDITSLLVSVDKRRLKEAKQRIREFKQAFIEEFNSQEEEKDAVYCLGIQLFNLTNAEERV